MFLVGGLFSPWRDAIRGGDQVSLPDMTRQELCEEIERVKKNLGDAEDRCSKSRADNKRLIKQLGAYAQCHDADQAKIAELLWYQVHYATIQDANMCLEKVPVSNNKGLDKARDDEHIKVLQTLVLLQKTDAKLAAAQQEITELSSLRSRFADSTAALRDTEGQLADANSSLHQAQDALTATEQQLADSQQQGQDLQQQLDTEKQQHCEAKQELLYLQDKVIELQQQHSDVEAEAAVEVATLKAQVAALESDLQEMIAAKSELQAMASEVQEVAMAADAAKQQVQQLQEQTQRDAAKVAEMQELTDTLRQALDTHKVELAESELHREHLQQQLAAADSASHELQQVMEAQQPAACSTTEISLARREVGAVLNDVALVHSEIGIMRSTLTTLPEELTVQESELSAIQLDADRMRIQLEVAAEDAALEDGKEVERSLLLHFSERADEIDTQLQGAKQKQVANRRLAMSSAERLERLLAYLVAVSQRLANLCNEEVITADNSRAPFDAGTAADEALDSNTQQQQQQLAQQQQLSLHGDDPALQLAAAAVVEDLWPLDRAAADVAPSPIAVSEAAAAEQEQVVSSPGAEGDAAESGLRLGPAESQDPCSAPSTTGVSRQQQQQQEQQQCPMTTADDTDKWLKFLVSVGCAGSQYQTLNDSGLAVEAVTGAIAVRGQRQPLQQTPIDRSGAETGVEEVQQQQDAELCESDGEDSTSLETNALQQSGQKGCTGSDAGDQDLCPFADSAGDNVGLTVDDGLMEAEVDGLVEAEVDNNVVVGWWQQGASTINSTAGIVQPDKSISNCSSTAALALAAPADALQQQQQQPLEQQPTMADMTAAPRDVQLDLVDSSGVTSQVSTDRGENPSLDDAPLITPRLRRQSAGSGTVSHRSPGSVSSTSGPAHQLSRSSHLSSSETEPGIPESVLRAVDQRELTADQDGQAVAGDVEERLGNAGVFQMSPVGTIPQRQQLPAASDAAAAVVAGSNVSPENISLGRQSPTAVIDSPGSSFVCDVSMGARSSSAANPPHPVAEGDSSDDPAAAAAPERPAMPKLKLTLVQPSISNDSNTVACRRVRKRTQHLVHSRVLSTGTDADADRASENFSGSTRQRSVSDVVPVPPVTSDKEVSSSVNGDSSSNSSSIALVSDQQQPSDDQQAESPGAATASGTEPAAVDSSMLTPDSSSVDVSAAAAATPEVPKIAAPIGQQQQQMVMSIIATPGPEAFYTAQPRAPWMTDVAGVCAPVSPVAFAGFGLDDTTAAAATAAVEEGHEGDKDNNIQNGFQQQKQECQQESLTCAPGVRNHLATAATAAETTRQVDTSSEAQLFKPTEDPSEISVAADAPELSDSQRQQQEFDIAAYQLFTCDAASKVGHSSGAAVVPDVITAAEGFVSGAFSQQQQQQGLADISSAVDNKEVSNDDLESSNKESFISSLMLYMRSAGVQQPLPAPTHVAGSDVSPGNISLGRLSPTAVLNSPGSSSVCDVSSGARSPPATNSPPRGHAMEEGDSSSASAPAAAAPQRPAVPKLTLSPVQPTVTSHGSDAGADRAPDVSRADVSAAAAAADTSEVPRVAIALPGQQQQQMIILGVGGSPDAYYTPQPRAPWMTVSAGVCAPVSPVAFGGFGGDDTAAAAAADTPAAVEGVDEGGQRNKRQSKVQLQQQQEFFTCAPDVMARSATAASAVTGAAAETMQQEDASSEVQLSQPIEVADRDVSAAAAAAPELSDNQQQQEEPDIAADQRFASCSASEVGNASGAAVVPDVAAIADGDEAVRFVSGGSTPQQQQQGVADTSSAVADQEVFDDDLENGDEEAFISSLSVWCMPSPQQQPEANTEAVAVARTAAGSPGSRPSGRLSPQAVIDNSGSSTVCGVSIAAGMPSRVSSPSPYGAYAEGHSSSNPAAAPPQRPTLPVFNLVPGPPNVMSNCNVAVADRASENLSGNSDTDVVTCVRFQQPDHEDEDEFISIIARLPDDEVMEDVLPMPSEHKVETSHASIPSNPNQQQHWQLQESMRKADDDLEGMFANLAGDVSMADVAPVQPVPSDQLLGISYLTNSNQQQHWQLQESMRQVDDTFRGVFAKNADDVVMDDVAHVPTVPSDQVIGTTTNNNNQQQQTPLQESDFYIGDFLWGCLDQWDEDQRRQ